VRGRRGRGGFFFRSKREMTNVIKAAVFSAGKAYRHEGKKRRGPRGIKREKRGRKSAMEMLVTKERGRRSFTLQTEEGGGEGRFCVDKGVLTGGEALPSPNISNFA